jgi:hypothetical protein
MFRMSTEEISNACGGPSRFSAYMSYLTHVQRVKSNGQQVGEFSMSHIRGILVAYHFLFSMVSVYARGRPRIGLLRGARKTDFKFTSIRNLRGHQLQEHRSYIYFSRHEDWANIIHTERRRRNHRVDTNGKRRGVGVLEHRSFRPSRPEL